MYEENRNQGFDGNGSPDNHRAEETAPNFILKDSQTQEGENGPEQASAGQTQNQAAESRPRQGDRPVQGSGQYQGQSQPAGGYRQVQPYGGSSYEGNGSQPYQGNDRFAGAYQSGSPYGGQNFASNSGRQAGPQNSHDSDHNKHKKGTGRKMASKVAGITAAALLFGVVSGGTMVGVNMIADSMKEETYPQVSQAETQPPTAAVETPSSRQSAPVVNNILTMDVSSIVEKAMPSIVAVNNTMLYESNSWFGQRQTYEVPSSGSGIIVGQNDEELLIVTNNHVVEDSTSTSVVFIDNTSVEAAIKGTDADVDLAVIAVQLKDIPADTLSQISVATLGNSDEMKMGQGVIAIGNALGHGQSTTVGFISAVDREVTTDGSTARNLIQTDAAINPGNSGGALLNMKGEVIGINVAKYASTEVEGVGYAIPISKVEDIIGSLTTKRTRNNVVEEGKEGYLGIQGLTVDDTMARQLGMPSGIFVSGIIENGAASKTDLREKDIITKFDDQTVRTMASLQELLKYYKEGETVTMTVQSLQDGEYVERTIEITLGGKATLDGGTRQ